MKKLNVIALLLCALLLLPGCTTPLNNTAKGGMIGGGAGAGAGALIGGLIGKGKGAAIGAAIGGGIGAGAGVLIGKKMDKAAQQAAEIEGATVERGEITEGENKGTEYVKVTLDSGITFPTNGTKLSKTAESSLSRFANELDPLFDIAICGHTDNTGSLQVNQRISLQRAQSVANHLNTAGIAYSRLRSVKGYDYQYPVGDNATAEGRAQNRRVELYIIPSEKMIQEANQQAAN